MTTPTDATEAPSVFRVRAFVALWAGEGVGKFGTQFAQIATPVVAVTLLGATELELGVLNAATTVAFLVVGLPAGAWIDRMRKRRVLIAADVVRAAAVSVLPLLWWIGVLEFWHLVVVGLVLGVATVFFDVAYQSYLPHLVPASRLGQGNAVLEATSQVASVGGPAIGGAALAVVAAPVVLLGNALSFVVSAAALTTIRDAEPTPDPAARRPLRVEIAEGVRFVARQPLIRSVALTTAGFNLWSSAVFTLYPLLVLRELGLSPTVLGAVMSVAAVGGLLGAVGTPLVTRLLGGARAILVSSIVGAVALAAIPLAAAVPTGVRVVDVPVWPVVVLVAGEFVTSAAVVVYNVTQVTLRQRLCPPPMLGRMNASIRTLVWGVMPIGALLGGALGAGVGTVPTFWIAVAGTVLACVPVFASPLRRLRDLPDGPEAPVA